MNNFVTPKSYWDEAARTNPFGTILDTYNEEEFWKYQPELPGLKNDMLFLDFGCGIGRIARSISPLVKEYHGVDYSVEMIAKAKEYHKDYSNVQFFANSGCDLSIFEDNKFDFIFECLVFIHVPKEQIIKYVNEIYRILKSGGTIYTVNFPSQKSYENGFSSEEIHEIFKNFGKINIKERNEWMYLIQCSK